MMWKHFWKNEQGLAYLEFALLLPLLMTLFLGTVEVSRYVQASQTVDKLSHTLVDLVAQAPTISVSDMNQIMDATAHITKGMNFSTKGIVIISCVGYDASNKLVVKWQYKGGGSLARSSKIGSSGGNATLPTGFTIESKDNVLVAESYLAYTPLVNTTIVQPIEFYRTAFYLPRLGQLDTLASN